MFIFQITKKSITKEDVTSSFSNQMQQPDEQLKTLKNTIIATISTPREQNKYANIDAKPLTKNIEDEKFAYRFTYDGTQITIEKTNKETGKTETKIFDSTDVIGIQEFVNNDTVFKKLNGWLREIEEENRKKTNTNTDSDYTSFINGWKQANEADKQTKEGNAASQKAVDDHSPAETPGSVYLADAVEQGVAKKKGGKKKKD